MDGREVALATLYRQPTTRPCVNYGWITHPRHLSVCAGRDYWSDPEGVLAAWCRHCGVNLIPQWYLPGEQHRRLAAGLSWDEAPPAGLSPEAIVAEIEALPDDDAVAREYDHEAIATAYAAELHRRHALLGPDVLVIDHFGMADFMGPYTRWGYGNYLEASALYPEAMRRYYHHTALRGRLFNQAIGLAVERHGLAPFVYRGQDICTAHGPIMSPAMLRDLYFPELRWAIEPLHDAGVGIIWHCDGDIRPILDDLLSLGVVGLQGFEEEHGVDYAALARLTATDGRPLGLWGCVSVVTTLPHGRPDDVRRAVERSFTAAGPGRGHVLSSTSSILPECPLENLDALFRHARSFGREFLGG